MTVEVYKATGITREVPELQIIASAEFPTNLSTADACDRYEMDAESITAALVESLPGGTLHRIMRNLFARSVSSWRIADDMMRDENAA